MVDVGVNGRISDGGVIEMTEFFARLKNNELNLPNPNQTVAGLNFSFLGDSAFSLRPDVLKPFPQKGITHDNLVFQLQIVQGKACSRERLWNFGFSFPGFPFNHQHEA